MNSINSLLDMIATEAAEMGPDRRYYGVPGHCFDADGERWHEPGKCKGAIVNCSGKCCGYEIVDREPPDGSGACR